MGLFDLFKKKSGVGALHDEKTEEFAQECREYIETIHNSKTIQYISQLVANCNQTYDYLRVETFGICCGRFSKDRITWIVNFEELKIKDLSSYRLSFDSIPVPTLKEKEQWVEEFKAQHEDIVGLSLRRIDYGMGDYDYYYALCLDERVVVGYAIIRLLNEDFVFDNEGGKVVFKKKTCVSDSYRDWS